MSSYLLYMQELLGHKDKKGGELASDSVHKCTTKFSLATSIFPGACTHYYLVVERGDLNLDTLIIFS